MAQIKRRYPKQLEELELMLRDRENGLRPPYIDSKDTVVLWDALEMMDVYIRLEEVHGE